MPATDANDSYFSGTSIFQLPFSAAMPGAMPKVLLPSGGASLVVSDSLLYYVDASRAYQRWDPGGSFYFTTLASGSPILADGTNDWGVQQPKADADKVYYREENGTLAWAKTDGTDCRIVVRLPSRISDDNDWAMTDAHYYFITNHEEQNELPR